MIDGSDGETSCCCSIGGGGRRWKDWSSYHDHCDGNGINFDDHASIGGRGWKMS